MPTLQTSVRGGSAASRSTIEPADWIAVASAEHVRRGVALGIIQVCHGKAGPLRRVAPGSRIAYYSPTGTFGGSDRLQSFTAFGIVEGGDIYQVDMGGGFHPQRRKVRYLHRCEAPIRPLLDHPEFALSGRSWGRQLRFGLLRIDAASMDAIALAMDVPEAAIRSQ